jgi:bifunctional UDP-N-acetylglucosamine pyrophosphorylase/glucosamine-1-phosphate N-acetyltransferase
MTESLRVLVAAAGRGTRAGLPYPKALFPILGEPILIRIAKLLAPYDNEITVIASPDGEESIRQCLDKNGINFQLVVQPKPLGMGDAVLRFLASSAYENAEHVLLIWGDIPFIQPETVAAMVVAHETQGNDFTFVTRQVDSAYTIVSRDTIGNVVGVVETREAGICQPQMGERDIGLFVFRKSVVLDMLREDLPGKLGLTTGEHGFLYIIHYLVLRGLRVVGLPLGTELDLVSLNSMKDINAYL